MRNLAPVPRKKIKLDDLTVSLNGQRLNDKERLVDLDFYDNTLIVDYPDFGQYSAIDD